MKKQLACADLVPDCPQVMTADTEEELVAEAGRHAEDVHGMKVTPELIEKVRANIQLVPETSQANVGAPGS